MQNDENWQAAIDWSTFDPVGGIRFHDFIKVKCAAALAVGIAELERMKAEREEKIRRWEELAKLFTRLDEDFATLRATPDFVEMMNDVDLKALLLFPAEKFITIERWVRWGEFLAKSLKTTSRIPPRFRAELAGITRDLANANTLKSFFAAYVAACEKDFLLRRAPLRYRTKLFREMARDVAALVALGEQINLETAPEFVKTLADQVTKIKELARRTAKTCRLAKKAIERSGESFWRDFSAWNDVRFTAS